MTISFDPGLFVGPAVTMPAHPWWQDEPLVDADPWPLLVFPAAAVPADPALREPDRRRAAR